MDTEALYNIMKYAFIIDYMLENNLVLFIDEYKVKLIQNLLKVDDNYAYVINLEGEELHKEVQKILKIFFENVIINE
ncbi:hypothetical protein [Methanobrevibacter sp.]|uniref:hypothetical protein n=1 Tax=Methanobrevibacter sp. TaxID=66852 RepID=UPI00386C4B2C